jgi:hypothetical protein
MYVHACMHTYIRMFVHTYGHMHTHTHAYIHTYIHTYIHSRIHIYIHTYIHTFYSQRDAMVDSVCSEEMSVLAGESLEEIEQERKQAFEALWRECEQEYILQQVIWSPHLCFGTRI